MAVAIACQDLEDAVADVENRDIEGAAAEVEDRDALVCVLFEAIGQCCGSRFIDDAIDLEAGDLTGILGRLTLTVIEVGREP